MANDLSSDEDGVRESVPTSLIKEMCTKWREVQLFVKKHHLDTMLANRAVHILNNNAMMHLRKMLQHRQKQLTLSSSWLTRLGKQLQRKKNQLPARDREGGEMSKGELSSPQIKYKIRLIIMHFYYVLLFCILMFHKYTSFSNYI